MTGHVAATVAVLIWASYPVATRAGVTGAFAAFDLITLRFGVGAVLFLPFLLVRFRGISPSAWLRGVPLALLQGIGMATLVICGLQFAPAAHAAALVPGVSPAWVALLGFVFYGKRPPRRVVAGSALCVAGAALLAWWNTAERNAAVLAGDAMFLAASALGAAYVLGLRDWRVGPVQAAAIVSVYSAFAVVPWGLGASSSLWTAEAADFWWQVLWQGLLIGCVAFVALNHAISRLGPERSTALVAFVPVLTALLGMLFLKEIPSLPEFAALAAVSAGVAICSAGFRPADQPSSMPQQNVRHADFPGPGSGP
ncbi:MAG TPA: DMT family transporter [Burkholderiales bacterium]|nr:DMT family transporter [Burkholderiales bacterium]